MSASSSIQNNTNETQHAQTLELMAQCWTIPDNVLHVNITHPIKNQLFVQRH